MYRIGLDIGSTTVKLVLLDEEGKLCFSRYQRHGGRIAQHVKALMMALHEEYPALEKVALATSGSAGMGLAEKSGLPFVQEVHATRIAARALAPDADVIIELGGEDAKLLFLTGLFDARMNGSCAGGTGAFIDQMATFLQMTPEALNEQAKKHERIYTIASRCGVFAKSDIQPLLNQGARVEDVASSIFYAVVNQTVAGLAQGRAIEGKVLYLGGPLTYLSELRAAFDHVLKVEGVLPEDSLYYVAIGAALSAQETISMEEVASRMQGGAATRQQSHLRHLFTNEAEYEAFLARHAKAAVPRAKFSGSGMRVHLGIDAGSTTVKLVLVDDEGKLLYTKYQPNKGNPLPALRKEILKLYERFPGMLIGSATATGYGEKLVKEAFSLDYGVIETIAHYTAAKRFQPDVDFIIDIGGQDMKCFKIVDGSIGDMFLNEACSSGCGSFLQAFAEALGEDIEPFSKRGLYAADPVDLGSRCTVFMNSSVKQAQRDGDTLENISAGLAFSVVKNALYKVIRTAEPSQLGRRIVVQGGTFQNDAVLRAFEQEMGMNVTRPDIAGLMGAYGAALYGKAMAQDKPLTGMLSRQQLVAFTYETKTTNCGLCANRCTLTVNTFSDGRKSISGNRCERPATGALHTDDALDLYHYKQTLLDGYKPIPGGRGKIGLPMVLNFYELLPFWHTLLTGLGFEVITSPRSSRSLYFKGQRTIPSDTVCYPAKLAHGHILALCERDDLDTIFYPCMTYNVDEGLGDNHFNCPVVAYYPEVLAANCSALDGKRFIQPYLGIHRQKDFPKKLHAELVKHYSDISMAEVKTAVKAAYKAYEEHLSAIRTRAEEIILQARAQGKPIIVLAGRPYHIDGEINHGIPGLILQHGAAVVSEDGISHLQGKQPTHILNQWTYHARLFATAHYVASQPDMHMVQLVSFGCGLDAVTTDEVREILSASGKIYTQIKIDEIENLGAANIRLRSLLAAVPNHAASAQQAQRELEKVV